MNTLETTRQAIIAIDRTARFNIIEGEIHWISEEIPQEQIQAAILTLKEINSLESQVTNRRMREAASDGAGGSAEGREWLANQNNLISAERVKL